jgi:hypothetical protein
LPITSEHLSISLIGSQIDCESNQLLADNGLRAMDNKLINKWDAVSESESSLRFVFLTQMVKKLNDLSSESWGF